MDMVASSFNGIIISFYIVKLIWFFLNKLNKSKKVVWTCCVVGYVCPNLCLASEKLFVSCPFLFCEMLFWLCLEMLVLLH